MDAAEAEAEDLVRGDFTLILVVAEIDTIHCLIKLFLTSFHFFFFPLVLFVSFFLCSWFLSFSLSLEKKRIH